MADQRDVVPTIVIEAVGVHKTHGSGAVAVHALRGIDLRVDSSSFLVVEGRSGSGKTTLLNILGGLDEPTEGNVRLNGEAWSTMNESARSEARRTQVGFIFQAFGLLPILTAAENVELPLRLVGADQRERAERARDLLAVVGLAHRADHRPTELSGGEQQRVAIARALANRPRLILADEPTGQLDSRTGGEIVSLLESLVHEEGIATVVATHDAAHRAVADRVLELHDGVIRMATSVEERS